MTTSKELTLRLRSSPLTKIRQSPLARHLLESRKVPRPLLVDVEAVLSLAQEPEVLTCTGREQIEAIDHVAKTRLERFFLFKCVVWED